MIFWFFFICKLMFLTSTVLSDELSILDLESCFLRPIMRNRVRRFADIVSN